MMLSRYVICVKRSYRVLRVGLALAGVLTVTMTTVAFAQPADAHGACHATRTHHCPVVHHSSRAKTTSSSGISAWAPVPGHPTYTAQDFAGDPNHRYFGVCTWWASNNDKPEGILGNAKDWTSNAKARGYPTGETPVIGATVVFQPGVEGASALGHVGHVEEVLNGGWFVISEMNFYWNGGGWGRVDYRYIQMEPGVSFVYQE